MTVYLHARCDDALRLCLGGDDNKWNITEAGTYDVELNAADMTISFREALC